MTCTSQREERGRRGNMPSHIPRPPHSIRGVEIKLHIFLTLTQTGGEWLASCSACFTSGIRTPVPTGQETVWTPEPLDSDTCQLTDSTNISAHNLSASHISNIYPWAYSTTALAAQKNASRTDTFVLMVSITYTVRSKSSRSKAIKTKKKEGTYFFLFIYSK